MTDKEYYTSLKTILERKDETATKNTLDAFQKELEYGLTELLTEQKYEELNDKLHSAKRIKRLLTGFADHDISYQIGSIMGMLQIAETFAHRQMTQKEADHRLSALFAGDMDKKILLYVYGHPAIQHGRIAEALAVHPDDLDRRMCVLEEAGGVVRYGTGQHSFYELTLDGRAFVEKSAK